jgi:stage III sporulation protein AG
MKVQTIKLSKEKKEKISIIFLLGIFFLLLATPISTLSKENKSDSPKTSMETDLTEEIVEVGEKDEYIEGLENKLEQTIGGMEGAGKVLVMITLKDSGEKILDKNQPYESSSEVRKEEGTELQQSSIKSDQETVLIEEEGNTCPIVVQELYPDIEGVVVVCEGGDNSELSLKIKEAVQALFSIDAHKIVVCKLQQ